MIPTSHFLSQYDSVIEVSEKDASELLGTVNVENTGPGWYQLPFRLILIAEKGNSEDGMLFYSWLDDIRPAIMAAARAIDQTPHPIPKKIAERWNEIREAAESIRGIFMDGSYRSQIHMFPDEMRRLLGFVPAPLSTTPPRTIPQEFVCFKSMGDGPRMHLHIDDFAVFPFTVKQWSTARERVAEAELPPDFRVIPDDDGVILVCLNRPHP